MKPARSILSFFFLFAIIVLGLPSCRRSASVRRCYLRPLTSLIDATQHKEGITVQVKRLEPKDCESLLGKNAHRLFRKIRTRGPYTPLQISLKNETNKLITFKPEDIDLPQVPYDQIVQRVSKNSCLLVFGSLISTLLIGALLIGGSFAALSASGILLLATGSLGFTAPFALTGGLALASVPAFFVIGTPVVTTMQALNVRSENRQLAQSIAQYAIQDHVLVEPHTCKDMLLFVETKKFRSHFTIRVTNPENALEHLEFNMQMRDNTLY